MLEFLGYTLKCVLIFGLLLVPIVGVGLILRVMWLNYREVKINRVKRFEFWDLMQQFKDLEEAEDENC